jgi:anthranilate phosphoribosyltransferase
MIRDVISRLVEGKHLSREESAAVMGEIMEGQATQAQIGSFLTALRLKGETPEEITGFAETMRKKATRIDPGPGTIVDTCGTGGDAKGTFNISTAAAIVVAGTGVTVAKHGNRSVSSRCGSADVLEALGVNTQAPVNLVEESLRQAKIGFLFAPLLHSAMKHAIGPRREIGIRTVFNILGPLTNPAGAQYQLIGVFSGDLTETLAEVLRRLGLKAAMVVHGKDGMDEISTTATTKIAWLDNGSIKNFELIPEEFGIDRARPEDLVVENADQSAAELTALLAGKPGPIRDIVVLNASAVLLVAGKAADFPEGITMAAESIDSGAAKASLEKLIAITNQES